MRRQVVEAPRALKPLKPNLPSRRTLKAAHFHPTAMIHSRPFAPRESDTTHNKWGYEPRFKLLDSTLSKRARAFFRDRPWRQARRGALHPPVPHLLQCVVG